ncbi:hypothetical protein ACFQPA_03900 [Halomarina halobia]|uniref:Uncharacterized protein n=1 Tax=Halomarina halobia TaxID=3033386 RepID=A0ABD6A6C6_9EURY|nr:hypothetical protein [Halomarina sp. PSR21]
MEDPLAHIDPPPGWTCEADPHGEELRFRHETEPVVITVERCRADHHVLGDADMWKGTVSHGFPDARNETTFHTAPTIESVLDRLPLVFRQFDETGAMASTPSGRYPVRTGRPSSRWLELRH